MGRDSRLSGILVVTIMMKIYFINPYPGSFFFLAACFMPPVRGASVLVDSTVAKVNLVHSSRILKDPAGKLTIDEVVLSPWAGRFRPQGGSGNNLGATRSAFWIRLDLKFSGVCPGRYLLEVPYPPLDELTAYLPDGEGGMRVVETGDSKPFSQRDVENHDFVFQLPAGIEGRHHIFLRVASRGTIIVPLYLWQEQAFSKNEQTEQLLRGNLLRRTHCPGYF